MRFDEAVYFQKITQGAYDPATGDYADPVVEETVKYGSIVDTSVKTMQLVYGQIRQGSVTVTLPLKYEGAFDRIRIGDSVYRADVRQSSGGKDIFVCSEVP